MREIVRRIVVVLWLAAIAGALYNVLHRGIFNTETWQIVAIIVLPVWALQYILTGIKNPIKLFTRADNTGVA